MTRVNGVGAKARYGMVLDRVCFMCGQHVSETMGVYVMSLGILRSRASRDSSIAYARGCASAIAARKRKGPTSAGSVASSSSMVSGTRPKWVRPKSRIVAIHLGAG